MRKLLGLLILATVIQLAAAQATYVFEEDQLMGPETISATGYYELTLQNNGAERYNVSVIRLGEGKTAEDYKNALETLMTAFQSGGDVAAGLAALAEAGSGVGGVFAEAGVSGTAGLILEPGSYLLSGYCDSCPPNHNQQLVSLAVEDGPRTEAPAADVTVEMVDFHFSGIPAELEAGPKLWDVANTGEQGHVFVLVKLAEGATVEDFTVWMATPESRGGEMPETLGSDVPSGYFLDPGGRYFETIDLAPGSYVVVCPIPDPATGQPHYDLGMIQTLDVE